MPGEPLFDIAPAEAALTGTVVLPVATLADLPLRLLAVWPDRFIDHAARIERFEAARGKVLSLIAPAGAGFDRLLLLGIGEDAVSEQDWLHLGGTLAGSIRDGEQLLLLQPQGSPTANALAALAAGVLLRRYSYRPHGAAKDALAGLRIAIETGDAARLARFAALVEGVCLARDLTNMPPNLLGPVELADACLALRELGASVEIIDETAIDNLSMGALQAVAQGSARPPRVIVLGWSNAGDDRPPICLVGKGVTFDSGGYTMKPGAGMELLKGDMGGAAAIIGAVHALARSGAKVNVIGVIAATENMVDGAAMRPGDVVTTHSGQTIEITNTDAEGRLILADALSYTVQRFEPEILVDIATLTGIIMLALGSSFAGLFSNDDRLAEALIAAGTETHERFWRMPLDPEYDARLASKVADMVNFAGRPGNAIIAAQVLQRFVGSTRWAHLDIAGRTMGFDIKSEINDSWGSGFGVRILERFIRDQFLQAAGEI